MLEFFKNLLKGENRLRLEDRPSATGPVLNPPQVAGTQRRRRGVPNKPERFQIPFAVIEATARLMRRFGAERRECYVWWGGYFDSLGTGQVLTAILPETPTEYGRIHLDRRELRVLQETLRGLDQVLLFELHTHPPGAGGQNEVDAAHPAAPYPGFITVVVPDFGDVNLADLSECHVYEYVGEKRWRELGSQEIRSRFIVDRTDVPVHFTDEN